MNYHLMVDDKFIDGFIDAAEKVAPGMNTYIFTFNPPGNYVKSTRGHFAPYGSSVLSNMISKITAGDRVFVHWFNDQLLPYIENLPAETPLHLFFWGGDFLEQPKHFQQFNLEPLTRKFLSRSNRFSMFRLSKNPMNYLRQLARFLFLKQRLEKERKDKVNRRSRFLTRLNFFCHWNEMDLDRIKEAYPCNAVFKPFFYDFGFDKFPSEVLSESPEGTRTIYLGNSASIPNNHIDALYALEQFKNEDVKIICPLSYGNARYGDYVSKIGKRIFGEKFTDLRQYMPIEEYFKMIMKLDVIVMYHNRTQAAANIFAFLRMGKKVFLKRESTIFRLAELHGIKVFDANQIESYSFEKLVSSLTEETKIINNKLVNEIFSETNRYEYMKKLLV
ncbi:MAG TPA: TDP-N-acetylfucosamine:lipid II N-acetylfucosaminyltransferase [Ferruginibacter sp.]|nr:TDP-N-acetylfucosamine:lipid II N-acetylfucosaminyltransferase [Ferruginibacter sp.]HRQ19911.1 TDP-N-acetylfucosamine:lipid II N-acetylfucosaminyltransferase [Ferruginibacter sp.]